MLAFVILAIIIRGTEDNAVQLELRRLFSGRKRKSYVEQHKDMIRSLGDNKYRIHNSHVTCEYSVNEIIFRFKSLENPDENAYAQMDFKCFDIKECISFLDFVMYSFNKNTNFAGLHFVFSENKNFMVVSNTKPHLKEQPVVKQVKALEEKININKAGEEEIAKLPGINIVKAKKVVQYRILHNGFKDIDEFIKIAGIKPNFRETVERNIMLGRYVSTEVKTDERQIDF